MRLKDFSFKFQEQMMQIAKSCFSYGLPLDDDWEEGNIRLQHALIEELDLDDMEDYWDLANDLIGEV